MFKCLFLGMYMRMFLRISNIHKNKSYTYTYTYTYTYKWPFLVGGVKLFGFLRYRARPQPVDKFSGVILMGSTLVR